MYLSHMKLVYDLLSVCVCWVALFPGPPSFPLLVKVTRKLGKGLGTRLCVVGVITPIHTVTMHHCVAMHLLCVNVSSQCKSSRFAAAVVN